MIGMVSGYVTAALWDSSSSLNDNFRVGDLDPETLRRMTADCCKFRQDNEKDIEASGLTDEQVGHDFWLTRNRSGAGFWDRELGEIGDRLTESAHAYGEANLYRGDDGKVYQY